MGQADNHINLLFLAQSLDNFAGDFHRRAKINRPRVSCGLRGGAFSHDAEDADSHAGALDDGVGRHRNFRKRPFQGIVSIAFFAEYGAGKNNDG